MDMNRLRVEALRQIMGNTTQADFAEKHDLNASYISQILTGSRSFGEKAARNMEGKIGVPAGTLSRPDLRIIEGQFENLDNRRRITSNVEGEPIALKDGRVAVVGKAKLGAGGYFEATDYPPGFGEGWVLISSSDPNAYALRVVGDSMEPRIRNGEFVMIEPNRQYVSGDDVLVQFQDGLLVQSIIKVFMYERDGFVRLLSINDTHSPMSIECTRILKIHPVSAILQPNRFVPAD
ncbi:LexA family transcriptional regulator [Pseudomonas sp. LRF_L74]|uniref:LexA family transcriptional regulator n=1 Tax=Pseudomonas sp. LRF_L74 TaxID=3369422 RepID=UPI003F6150E8